MQEIGQVYPGVILFSAAIRQSWRGIIESVLSAGIVVFAVRTRLPFMYSKPSRAMLGMSLLVIATAITLPYSPLASLLDFTPLPPAYLLVILAIVVLYFISAEITKRWFTVEFEGRDTRCLPIQVQFPIKSPLL